MPVALRRKGLALLYVLALDGPTRRERLADLLWGHGAAANNLRVELHRLRKALADQGVNAFGEGADPLTLPDAIGLDASGSAEVLEGLEDLSPEFSEWLEFQRAVHAEVGRSLPPARTALLDKVPVEVRPPFVLVVQVRPGSTAAHLARELSAKLKLPFLKGLGAGGGAVHLLPADEDAGLWRHIAADDAGVWVLERTSLGEDPPLLLTLRSRLPAERIRYVELPLVSWWEARGEQLASLPFDVAAAHFLASGGQSGYLAELPALLSLSKDMGGEDVLVPQRVRAAYLLEAQKLSPAARLALERLSITPGPYGPALLERAGATEHLDELERLGWLTWNEDWRFIDGAARTVLQTSIQNGRRRRCEEEVRVLAKSRATSISLYPFAVSDVEAPTVKVGIGPPRALWTVQSLGDDATQRGDRFCLLRLEGYEKSSGVALELTDDESLVHISGQVYVPSAGRSEYDAALWVRSVKTGATIYLGSMEPGAGGGEVMDLDHWVYLANADVLRLESSAPRALIEFKVGVHSAAKRAEVSKLASDIQELGGPPEAWEPRPAEESVQMAAGRPRP